MKYLTICLILILGVGWAFQAHASEVSKTPANVDWESIDAVEAIAIANDWKWSQKDVKSSVTAREVIFEFADGTKKTIPLPEEKMLVAIAPYINRTHK
jgi:hypothetical protein